MAAAIVSVIVATVAVTACSSEPEETPSRTPPRMLPPYGVADPFTHGRCHCRIADSASHGRSRCASDTPASASRYSPKGTDGDRLPRVSFDRMVFLTHPDGIPDRLYLVLQPGRIMVFDNVPNPSSPETFLDIRNRVSDRGNEEGLLGLAFDPDYRNNGYFYVYYSAASPRRSVIARYHVPQGADGVDPSTEKIIMEIGQPYSNHNGGQVTFGP